MVLEPGATNYGRLNDDGSITPTDEPLYIINTVFDFEINPSQIGVESEERLETMVMNGLITD